MKDFFKTVLEITNLPGQEDYVKTEKFQREYLHHSFLHAKKKFETDLELIVSGKLLENISEPEYEEVIIQVKLVLVKVEEGIEKEIITRTSDEHELVVQLEEIVINFDNIEMFRELKKGHVRHRKPIEDTWHFEIESTKKMPGKTEEVETKKFELSVYGECETVFREMSYLNYIEESEIVAYDPEYGESFIIRKFLVQKNDDKEEKILLVENQNLYPLNPALAIEIKDKFYMEHLAARNYEEGPLFGKNGVIYEIEPVYREQQRNLKDPKVTFAVLLTFGDRNDPEFSEMVPYLYEETGGEDLFVEEAKAYNFYRDLYNDHTAGHLSSEIASELGSGDYFIQKVQFTYNVNREEQFRNLYQDNSLELDPEYAPRLREIKEKRRDDLSELNPHTQEDYVKIGDSLEILRDIKKYYIVFKGDNWVRPEKERVFYHHNLLTARKAAFHFYKQAIEDEFDSDLPQPVSLIIYASNLRDNPYYIASTDAKSQEYLEFGRQKERKFYEQLGYRLSLLEND